MQSSTINGRRENTGSIFQRASNFICELEGKVIDDNGYHIPYLCPANVWTIGYGETNPDIVNKGFINDDQAKFLLMSRLISINEMIDNNINVYINDNQRIALMSLIYNIGSLSNTPKLLSKLNNYDYDGAALELLDCNKITVDGEKIISPGLTNRRNIEYELWNKVI